MAFKMKMLKHTFEACREIVGQNFPPNLFQTAEYTIAKGKRLLAARAVERLRFFIAFAKKRTYLNGRACRRFAATQAHGQKIAAVSLRLFFKISLLLNLYSTVKLSCKILSTEAVRTLRMAINISGLSSLSPRLISAK